MRLHPPSFFSLLFSQNKEDFDFKIKNLTRQHAENKDAKKKKTNYIFDDVQ
jgi:hypothetical protein